MINYSDDESAPEKTREECCPGVPYIAFSTLPALPIAIRNPIWGAPWMEKNYKISTGENVEEISARIIRDTATLKGN